MFQSSDSESSAKKKLSRHNLTSLKRNRARTVFSHFKRFLITQDCPINFGPFFEVVDYRTKHRTFIDFELPYLYVEILETKRSGSLKAFRNYINSIKGDLIHSLEAMYGHDKIDFYRSCVKRLYKAFNSGEQTLGRIRLLYDGYRPTGLGQQLDTIWRQLVDAVARNM